MVDKKYIFPIVFMAAVLLWLGIRAGQQLQGARPAQQPLAGDIANMLPSTLPVDQKIQARVLASLEPQALDRGIFTYAITDVSQQDGGYIVSVAGLPEGSTRMVMASAIWLGTVKLLEGQQLGLVEETAPAVATAGPVGGYGGSGNILPFRSGTQALYGVLGVHSCGYSLSGWQAVDLFPTENMIYSVQSGSISYVCRDSTQVSMRIGNNLYAHLVDTGQQQGDQYNQGQALGSLVPGSFDDTCGYAAQNENAAHVHFCFIPDGGSFSADGYTLNASSSEWVKGVETVNPEGYLTASWVDGNASLSVPGPAAGGNLWDSVIGGLVSMWNGATAALPDHQNMSLAENVMASAAPAWQLMAVVMFGNFNMTVPLWVFGIIVTLELVRIVLAGLAWIWKVLPFA